MAFQAVPNTAEITIIYSQNAEVLANTLHAELPGGYTQLDITELAGLVDLVVGTDILPKMTFDSSYVRTEVRGLDVENDLFAVDNTAAGPGAIPNKGLPNSVTFSIKKNSAFTGRSARGRWYWVGPTQIALSSDENFFLSADIAGWVAAVEALRADITASQWNSVIVSRFAGGALRPVGVTFDWISTSNVDNRVDTQRRRLGK